MTKVAIIEDDLNMRKSLEIGLRSTYEVSVFKNGLEALEGLSGDVDVVIADVNMPKMDGITLLKKLQMRYDCIVITGNATLSLAIDALRLGAKDFIRKPFEIDTVMQSIQNVLKLKEATPKVAKTKDKTDVSSDYFIGASSALQPVIDRVNKVAKTDATVLLLGESGVGKEVFAHYIHKQSKYVRNDLVAVNMAAIPDNLLESELFGYEKGAFTDAKEMRKGKFELANNSTLFLDEIGEMPIELQAKLLRVIQEKELHRLGGTKGIKINVRIISATNASLPEKISNKTFREDLYYRLNTIPIVIPPLRERKDEILPIAQKTLEKTCQKYDLPEKVFLKKTQDTLLKYNWPGNIRELISVVERSVILSDGIKIKTDDLFLESRY